MKLPSWRPGWRSGVALLVLVAGLVATRTAIGRGAAVREGWLLLGMGADGSALVAELSVSNTGVIDGLLTTRLSWLLAAGGSLEHRAVYGPTVTTEEGVAAGPDALVETRGADGKEAWELAIGGTGLSARVGVKAANGCPPVPGALHGTLRDGAFSEGLEGRGLVSRIRAVGNVEDTALYVVGPAFALGIDPLSDCPAWTREGEKTWRGEPVPVALARRVRVVLGGEVLEIEEVGGTTRWEAMGHVLLAERWLSWAAGFDPPVLDWQRVRVGRPEHPEEGPLPGVRLRRTGWRPF